MSSRQVTIRKARLKDLEAIWNIYQAATPEARKPDNEYWKKLIRQGGMFVAEIGRTAIGFGGIDTNASEQIKQIYVAPEYQNSSARLGSRILEALEATARQEGVELIRLHSTPNAVGFYEKAGYSAVRDEDTFGHDHPGLEMEKELKVRPGNSPLRRPGSD